MRERRIEQIRRRWWVVLLVAVVAVLAAALPLLNAHPTYAAKSALVMSSPGRTPEQDAMMAVAYSTLFNEPATIERLRSTIKIPEEVTFEAQTVNASPILTIMATTGDPGVAQDAAQKMAEAFRDDINSVRESAREDTIAGLERQQDELRDQLSAQPPPPPEVGECCVERVGRPAGANRHRPV